MAGITTDEIDLYVRSEPSLLANYCGVYAIDQLIDEFVKCAQNITTKAGTSQTTLRNRQYRPDRQERHALDQSRQASRRILLYVRQFRPIGFFRIYRVRRSKANIHLSDEVRDLRAGQLQVLLLRV